MVAKEILSVPSKNFRVFEVGVPVVSSHIVPATAPEGVDVPDWDVLIACNAELRSVLKEGNDWFAITKSFCDSESKYII